MTQFWIVFKRLEYHTKSQETTMGKEDNPFKELQDKIDALRSIELDTLEENINMALLINKDGVSVEQILPIYTKILSKL